MTAPIATRRNQRVRFKQADLSRALKAAKDAGLAVERTRIMPTGEIVLEHQSDEVSHDSAFDEWKANARKAQGYQ
ncbi:hypothetical protein [Roseinatronobacter sp.]|uniref:hypothetical protein n=1 Tax=Roseinatronobacter sp. TaxID=1945755 RepID=UPI003F711A0F